MRKAKTNSKAKQAMWETWFAASVILVVVYAVTGVMDNSQEMFPNWYIFAPIAFFNLFICIYKGLTKY